MVNKVAKGKRAEKEFVEYLSKEYYVWRPTWSKYGQKDIFNIADIIALPKKGIYEDESPSTLFVQVKTNKSDFYKARKQIREFIKNINNKNNWFVVALKIKGKKWRIWHIESSGIESDIEKELIR